MSSQVRQAVFLWCSSLIYSWSHFIISLTIWIGHHEPNSQREFEKYQLIKFQQTKQVDVLYFSHCKMGICHRFRAPSRHQDMRHLLWNFLPYEAHAHCKWITLDCTCDHTAPSCLCTIEQLWEKNKDKFGKNTKRSHSLLHSPAWLFCWFPHTAVTIFMFFVSIEDSDNVQH